ncbi:hypothetical protein BGAL_0019g00120 [Botrytis galanthina]|uniref:Uncharacterized protein n=1 Tax=Botrytis galanthina TaxID=278940 RepID=A0A4S8RBQ2_9HELO|nr:hypothetical protein BGAL_0019g00120 [Botrytis galanthina]
MSGSGFRSTPRLTSFQILEPGLLGSVASRNSSAVLVPSAPASTLRMFEDVEYKAFNSYRKTERNILEAIYSATSIVERVTSGVQ